MADQNTSSTVLARQVAGGQPAEALPRFNQEAPICRSGQPAEPAPADVDLTSADAYYRTARALNVNGGMPTP